MLGPGHKAGVAGHRIETPAPVEEMPDITLCEIAAHLDEGHGLMVSRSAGSTGAR